MNPNFRDLLSVFNDQSVEYLVVGAHALAAHGHVRATKDLDIWVRPRQPGLVFQIGVPPVRIDVITAIDGVEFDAAWPDRVEAILAGLAVPYSLAII